VLSFFCKVIFILRKRKKYLSTKQLILIAATCFAIVVVGIYLLTQFWKAEKAGKFINESTIAGQGSILIRTDDASGLRQVVVPEFRMTFDVPEELRTGQELSSSIQDSGNARTVIRLYRKDTKYSKDSNGYDVADNTIIFSFDNLYGLDPIYGNDE
jgi:hypothetical protein